MTLLLKHTIMLLLCRGKAHKHKILVSFVPRQMTMKRMCIGVGAGASGFVVGERENL